MRINRVLLAGLAAVLMAWSHAAWADDLTFRVNDPDANGIRAALDVFQKQNPGIHVKLEQMAWAEAMPQFLREAAVGTGPDVVHIAFVWTKEMAAAGALLPLDKHIAADGGSSDYIAMDLATGRDGHAYAVPWTMDCWAMVYRTEPAEAGGCHRDPEDVGGTARGQPRGPSGDRQDRVRLSCR